MENILIILRENNTILLTTFLIILITMTYSLLINKINRTSRIRELELKNAMIENMNNESEDTVKKAITRIPEGVNEDEFFDRLKEELLEISYIQLKDDNIVNEDNSLFKFLESHHRQALLHSNAQFWVSICAAVIGFGFIIGMFCTALGSIWYEYILRVLPGTIIDAISVLFIKQAHEARDSAANFFKELNYEKYIKKSVAIADRIEDTAIKASVQARIALHIAGLKDEEIKKE